MKEAFRNEDKFEIFSYFDFFVPSKLSNLKINERVYPLFVLLVIHTLTLGLIWIFDSSQVFFSCLIISAIELTAEAMIIAYIDAGKQFYIQNAQTLFNQLKDKNQDIGKSKPAILYSRKKYQSIKAKVQEGLQTEATDSDFEKRVDKIQLKDDFGKWYFEDHLKPMFGYIFKMGKRLVLSPSYEISYWLYTAVFIIGWLGFAVLFPFQTSGGTFFWIARVINSSLFWLVVAYALRVIICSVRITEDYEKLDVSIPFYIFNNIGFDFLIKAWKKTMFYFIPFWVLFWMHTGIGYRHSLELDTIYVAAALLLVGYWSIRISKRTIVLSRKIRGNSLQQYEKKIIDKRDIFLENPTQASLYDLKKTLNLYHDYEKVMFKDFYANYVLAVFLNLWVFSVPIIYWVYYAVPLITLS